MPEIICSKCGERIEEDECPRCRAATAIAKPEHAEQAKVTPPAASDGEIREGEPAFPLPREEPWPYKHEPGAGHLLSCAPYVIVGLVLVTGIYLLLSRVWQVRDVAERTTAINHMKGIVIACHEYHDRFTHLPTPTLTEGKPADVRDVPLSWRVSVLPWLEANPLFREFDRAVGWDHPKNARFQDRMPHVFASPHNVATDPTRQTRFQFFTGPGTMFPANAPITLGDIKDGTSNTFLFAEADQAVIWTRPGDMAIRPDQPLPLPADVFLAAMADASVRTVRRDRFSDEILRQLIDPSDQKPAAGWDN